MNVFAYKSATSSDSIAKILVSEIDRHAKKFLNKTINGNDVTMFMRYITLPQIYVLDRMEVIGCVARPAGAEGRVKIDVNIMKIISGNAVGDFLSEMNIFSEDKLSYKDLVRSSQLYDIGTTYSVATEIVLMREIGSEELVAMFPDARNILNAEGLDIVKYAAEVPCTIDVSSFSTLSGLTEAPGFMWKTYNRGKKPPRVEGVAAI